MEIKIRQKQAEQIGIDKFTEFGCNEHSWWRGSTQEIDLKELTAAKLDALEALFVAHPSVYGAKSVLRDVQAWKDSLKNVSTAKVSKLTSLEPLMKRYLKVAPGNRLYFRDGDRWVAYYVQEIEYHPAQRYSPAYVTVELVWQEFGGKKSSKISFGGGDCHGTVSEMLAQKGYITETPALRETYLKETARFKKVINRIGKQYTVTGYAEFETDDDRGWWYKSVPRLLLTKARVVIDVFEEGEEEEKDPDEDVDANTSYWGGEDEELASLEIPIHPNVMVFHLTKHKRMTTHVTNLKKYKYRANMMDNLVIDDTRKALVRLLIEHRTSKYVDVIAGKSGGAIVMLCGSPGTGKTLTAEVFAESERRALYSVQCSQLGVTPEELETELLKVLTRAARWNAVLLLDEADVYVHKRGKDINQNAMVGVFLRVLEYQDAIMFLTTNRAKDIDDAVASRCTAKLIYQNPTYDEQTRIWRVLVNAAKAQMSDAAIVEVAKAHPELSGRDVKNLLKLAMLVSDEAITAKTIEFVKQFKPT